MTVKRGDGTLVPFVDYEESGMVRSYWMDTQTEFFELDEVFCQRNTEARIPKAKKHLSKCMIEHCSVVVAKLTRSDNYKGTNYKAGHRFRIDSNTRNEFWQRGLSDHIPKSVLVTEYSFDSVDRIRESYNTYDSPDSLERNQEKFWGIISGVWNYTPKSKKVQKGWILSGLNKAACFFQPDLYNQPRITTDNMITHTGMFLEEIKVMDEIMTKPDCWDQALFCMGIMALKKYGTDNDKVLEGLRRINKRQMDTMSKEMDGITHICLEWTQPKLFIDKTTTWGKQSGLDRTVSFCCYWMDKYVRGEKGVKVGAGWEETAKKWKDQKVATLNKALGIT
tara:strand:- start:48 stop:1055 length:1008 start_codon:yes stop_codon:yes gene_type:complete